MPFSRKKEEEEEEKAKTFSEQ